MKFYTFILTILLFRFFFLSTDIKAQLQWQLLNPYPTNNQITYLNFPSPERGFMIDGYNLYRSDDGGLNWNRISKRGRPSAVFFFDNDRGWIAKHDSLYYSTDGGESLQFRYAAGNRNISFIYWLNHETGFIAGDVTSFFAKTTDGGNTWQETDYFANAFSGLNFRIRGIKFTDQQNGYALFSSYTQSYFFHTSNGGTSWDTVPMPAGIDMMASFEILGKDYIWIGEGKIDNSSSDSIAKVWHSMNGGDTWTPYDLGKINSGNHQVNGIKFFNAMEGFAIVKSSVYITQDGGVSWSAYSISQIAANSVELGVFSAADRNYWVLGGMGPALVRTADGGKSFENLIKGYFDLNTTVYFTDSINGCVGSMGSGSATIRYTRNSGETWQLATADTSFGFIYDMTFASKNIGWFVSFQHLYRTEDGGKTWKSKRVPSPNSLYYISAPDTNHVFMKGFTYLLKTSDNGNTWKDIRIPGLNSFKDYDGSFQFTDSLTGYITYYNLDTRLSTLYKTINGGETWEILPTGPLRMIESISFSDNLHGVISTGSNILYKTTDGGYNWQQIGSLSLWEKAKMLDSLTIISYSGPIVIGATDNCVLFISVSHDGGKTFKPYNYPGYSCDMSPVTFFVSETFAISVGESGIIQRLSRAPAATVGMTAEQKIKGTGLVYPNPTTGKIRLNEPGFSSLVVSSIDGRVQLITTLGASGEADLSVLKPGIYILNLSGEAGRVSLKLVKL